MYSALSYAIDAIDVGSLQSDAWIICLTDGASADSEGLIVQKWSLSPQNLHLIVVGVNLASSIENRFVICARSLLPPISRKLKVSLCGLRQQPNQ